MLLAYQGFERGVANFYDVTGIPGTGVHSTLSRPYLLLSVRSSYVSPFGLLAGLFPLAVLVKAIQIVNVASSQVMESAKDAILKAGTRRVGVELRPDDDQRYCYIRSSKLIEYYSDPTVINALLDQLQVPGTTATHNLMGEAEKKAASTDRTLQPKPNFVLVWRRPHEILAASIWRCGGGVLSQRVVDDKFYDVSREEDLRRPVARWLQNRGEEPYMEIQLGRRRIDVLGCDKRRQRLTAVELKNSDEEFRRGPDQMASFAEYAHAVYLACTPAFAADYLERNAEHRAVNHWDPTLLDRKLKHGGFGLLIVERDAVFEAIKPVEQRPSVERVPKIIGGLPAFHKIDLD